MTVIEKPLNFDGAVVETVGFGRGIVPSPGVDRIKQHKIGRNVNFPARIFQESVTHPRIEVGRETIVSKGVFDESA